MIVYDTLIIGAGISGLILGNGLVQQGRNILILEKSRGVGGRISTRRIDDQGLDHGTLYLEHDTNLLDLIFNCGLSNNLRFTDEGYFVAGGMTAFPKALAKNIPITKEARATSLTRENSRWKIETDHAGTFMANNLVVTAPLPQALELLEHSRLQLNLPLEVTSLSYTKGLLALITANGPEPRPFIANPDIFSLTPMLQRGLHPKGYVLRMTPDFSERNYHFPDEELLKMLTREFINSFSTAPEILSAELKKWKYLQPKAALEIPYLEAAPSLFLIGDSFLSPDTKGAILSARMLLPKLV